MSNSTIGLAGTGKPGFVSTGSQSFSGQKTFVGGILSSNGNAAFAPDANTTLTSASSDVQMLSFTADRVYTLPTTGIVAGRSFTFINYSLFDISFLASAGGAITIAGGANMTATCRNGRVTLTALVNTPTTPGQWRVSGLYDEYDVTLTFVQTGGYSQTSATKLTRNNKDAIVYIPGFVATTTANATIATSVAMPRGFAASNTQNVIINTFNAGAHSTGYAAIDTTGGITLNASLTTSAFTNGASGGLGRDTNFAFRTA